MCKQLNFPVQTNRVALYNTRQGTDKTLGKLTGEEYIESWISIMTTHASGRMGRQWAIIYMEHMDGREIQENRWKDDTKYQRRKISSGGRGYKRSTVFILQ